MILHAVGQALDGMLGSSASVKALLILSGVLLAVAKGGPLLRAWWRLVR